MSDRTDRLKNALGGSVKREKADNVTVGYIDETAVETWPTLYEVLARTTFVEDGQTLNRKGASLIVFVEDGNLKVCVSDRHTGRVAFITVESLDTLLDAVEASLAAGELDWRKSSRGR